MSGSDVKTTRVTATGAASIGRCRLMRFSLLLVALEHPS